MRAAEEQQFTDYVTARLPTLRRTAYLLCGDQHRADDVVQTTLTKLYVHWRRARNADNLDAYVRAMLVRTFISEQRLAWARRTRLVGTPGEMPVGPAAPEPDVVTRRVVHAALTRVPPRARAVLVLRFLLDLSVTETAAALDCSPGNVKSQTSSGLTALRRLLGAEVFTNAGRE